MSSIATITDPNMLEYHRFRGSDSMVFWRLGLRRFSKFDAGDLVFFIDRRQRHPYSQEKGIIGFGRCSALSNKPLHKAWQLYEQRLGYETEATFKEAIRYYRKEDDTLPQRIQCIELTDIVLFQYPVFLSEVGFEMSERLESFTYLEHEGRDITHDVLNLAQEMGLDPWYVLHNPAVTLSRFDAAIKEHSLRQTLNVLPKIVMHRDLNTLKKYTTGVYFNGLFYNFDGKKVKLAFANISDIPTIFTIYGIHTYLKERFETYDIETTFYLKNPNQAIQDSIQALNLLLEEI